MEKVGEDIVKLDELCRADMGSVIHVSAIEEVQRPLDAFGRTYRKTVPECGAHNRSRYPALYIPMAHEYLFTSTWCGKCFPDGQPLIIEGAIVDPAQIEKVEALDTGEKKHLVATEKTFFCGRRRSAPSWYQYIDQDAILNKVQLCKACDKSYDLARDKSRRRIWAWLMKTG